MNRVWKVLSDNIDLKNELVKECKLPELAAIVLANRGYTVEKTKELLFPETSCFHDPYLMKDMDKAVNEIMQAQVNDDLICIFGDYDCDGVTATAMVYDYLINVGARACFYIPRRENEGYGLNINAIEELAKRGVKLLLTVDNGISSHEEIKRAKELGMKVVVTDHHQPSDTLPDADAVVNPHRADCTYPFKEICGAGVAFKLLCALEYENGEDLINQYGDLLTIGTIADVVELSDENRFFVKVGINMLENCERPGLNALIEKAGLSDKKFTSDEVSFGIAPRINAAGRMDSAEVAVELILSENFDEAMNLAEQLNDHNLSRKKAESEAAEKIYNMLSQDKEILLNRVIVIEGDNWNSGVVGIVCSRIVEHYQKPCIIITKDGDNARGSGRSIQGFSLIDAVTACSSVLTRLGGHPMAVGVSLETKNISKFREMINLYAQEKFFNLPPVELNVDAVISPNLLSVSEIKSLSLLEPFGCGNESPVFAIENALIETINPLSEGKHTKLKLSKDGVVFYVVCFSIKPEEFGFRVGNHVDIAFAVSVWDYMGEDSVSLKFKGIKKNGEDSLSTYKQFQEYEAILRNEIKGEEIIPTRDDVANVYKYIKLVGPVRYDSECLYRHYKPNGEKKYSKFQLSLDALIELGIVICEGDKIKVNLNSPKQDLFSAPIFRRISNNG